MDIWKGGPSAAKFRSRSLKHEVFMLWTSILGGVHVHGEWKMLTQRVDGCGFFDG